MSLRNLPTAIKTALNNNDPLLVYHLIKFEKPSQLDHEAVSATDYVYLTDAPYPVTYDSQTYHPGGVIKVGKVPENTEAKATTLNLILSATKLGKQTGLFTLTNSSSISSGASGDVSVNLDFFKSGFYPGDIVTFTPAVSGGPTPTFKARIDSIKEDGTKLGITNLEDSAVSTFSSVSYRAKFDSSEINALVEGGLDNSNSGQSTFSPISFDNYINRSVTIYRVFANPSTGVQIADPFILFKGIIAKGTLSEKAQGASTVTWSLTSHWGDFVRVAGRLTSDEFHRGLDSSGISNKDSALREEYVQDLGFMHADSSLNVLATYTDLEVRGKNVRRGGIAGALGLTKYKEEKFEVTREMDLRINIDARYIPIVYGVQKVDAIPVFADVVVITDSDSDDTVAEGNTTLYQAQVLSEGPIGGIYDIYIDDKGLICRDEPDADVRTGSDSDVPCVGRMDRGNVLGGANFYGSNLLSSNAAGTEQGLDSEDYYRDPNVTFIPPRLFGLNSGFQNKRTATDGIQHRETFSFPEAQGIHLTAHLGKADQVADQTLLSLATNGRFLVQQNYYRDDVTPYWSENHRLLDTAYVVTKDVISAEDGRAPNPSFVVRGKFLNCYNYDGSYKLQSGSTSDYKLGETVNIALADGSSGGTATVIDKWSFVGPLGVSEDRIRFSYSSTSTYNAIVKDGTVGKFTASKSGVTSLVFISPEYSNNSSQPADPSNPVTFSEIETFKKDTDNSDLYADLSIPITRDITNVTGSEAYLTGNGSDVAVNTTTQKHFKYTFNFGSLPSRIQSVIKIIAETGGTATLTLTGNSRTETIELQLDSLDKAAMTYSVIGQSGPLDIIMGGPTTTTGQTSTTATGGFRNHTVLKQNSSDSNGPTDLEGLNLKVTQEGLLEEDFFIRLPTTTSLRTFCTANDLIVLNKNLPDRFRTTSGTGVSATAKYSYGGIVPNPEEGIYADSRVSINPAIQLLDYLTSKRYGKGLDINKDLDLESFKEVARQCDTTSDVTIIIPTSSNIAVGNKYKYPTSGDVVWQGTVSSYRTITHEATQYYEVTFTDCIGKLGRKWYKNQHYDLNELVYSEKGYWSLIGSSSIPNAGSISKPTAVGGTYIYLRKVGGVATSDIQLDTLLFTNLGNPFVKKQDSNGVIVSGYSLYDSDDVKYWKYIGWDDLDQRYVTRHQTNATIDTSNSVFDNVNSMLRQFNGILRFSNGKYFLDQRVKAKNISAFDADNEIITEDQIVGDIKISDKGISKTFNSVNAQIIDPANNFEPRSIAFYNSDYKKQDKGIPRQGSYEAPGISNYFNARMNIKQVLDESRAGLEISFTMAPRGYMLLAGNIIAITYDRFNWTKKLYRIDSLNVRDDLLVDIVA